jgi:hypothetical protein
MSKKRNLVISIAYLASAIMFLLTWASLIKRIIFMASYGMFWAGLWQLDLLVCPAVWEHRLPLDTFLLPFDIPISSTKAYCLFYAWIIIGASVSIIIAWMW